MARGDVVFVLLLKINCHLIMIKSVSLNSHYEGRRDGRRGDDGRRGEDWGRCVDHGDDGDWGSAVSSGRRTASSSSRGFVASCPEVLGLQCRNHEDQKARQLRTLLTDKNDFVDTLSII